MLDDETYCDDIGENLKRMRLCKRRWFLTEQENISNTFEIPTVIPCSRDSKCAGEIDGAVLQLYQPFCCQNWYNTADDQTYKGRNTELPDSIKTALKTGFTLSLDIWDLLRMLQRSYEYLAPDALYTLCIAYRNEGIICNIDIWTSLNACWIMLHRDHRRCSCSLCKAWRPPR